MKERLEQIALRQAERRIDGPNVHVLDALNYVNRQIATATGAPPEHVNCRCLPVDTDGTASANKPTPAPAWENWKKFVGGVTGGSSGSSPTPTPDSTVEKLPPGAIEYLIKENLKALRDADPTKLTPEEQAKLKRRWEATKKLQEQYPELDRKVRKELNQEYEERDKERKQEEASRLKRFQEQQEVKDRLRAMGKRMRGE